MTTPHYDSMDITSENTQSIQLKKKIKNGNINNKINIQETSKKFVQYFYKELQNNYKNLINHNFLRSYTKVVSNTIKYEGDNIIPIFDIISKSLYKIHKIECVDSGSRAININVVGFKSDNTIFSHTFLICNLKDSVWYLKHVIFI
jgi:hypothetical protein